MTIVRDDYAQKPKRKQVHLETTNHCEMYAVYDGHDDFKISLKEDGECWYFGKEDLKDAIKYFERLIEIIDKGEH